MVQNLVVYNIQFCCIINNTLMQLYRKKKPSNYRFPTTNCESNISIDLLLSIYVYVIDTIM